MGRFPYATGLLAVLTIQAAAATIAWTNAAGDRRWSNPLNWDSQAAPTSIDTVVFGNGSGATNAPGAVNNIVDTTRTISNLAYNAVATRGSYHTTLINPGQTLALEALSTNSIERLISVEGLLGMNEQIYATIIGPGARLVLGDPASPKSNYTIYISVKATNAVAADSSHRATLDLSALDNFTFAGGFISVAGDGSTGANNQPAGTLLLAKTNLIIANRTSSTLGTIRISHNPGGTATGAAENLMELGQDNAIHTIYLRIGGMKALNGGAMRFRSGLTHPTLKLRGPDGVSRLSLLTLGDNWDTATGVASTGMLDLSGGTVDGLIETMHVARTFNNGGTTSKTGSGSGTLTFTAGTIDVTTLLLGCQGRNNAAIGTGVINVRNNASLRVGTLNIGGDAGTQAGTGNGTLNVDRGAVMVSGDIVENDAGGGDGSSTINITNAGVLNLQPPGDLTPGNITVDTLNFSSGALTNYGVLGLRTLNPLSPATAFTVRSGQTLTPVGPGANPIGTLTVNGNLTLSNATLHCDLSDSPVGTNDLLNVTGTLTLGGSNLVDLNLVDGTLGAGDYVLMTHGTLVGGLGNLHVADALAASRYQPALTTSVSPNRVVLRVGGSPPKSLIWTGDAAALWDLAQAANWNGNTEKFYALDTVTFDGTSLRTNVSLVGTLEPASVTVNTTNHYTFSGSGRIVGAGRLTKLGSGVLRILNSNDYTGATTVSNGTLLVNGALGNTAVSIASAAALGGTGVLLGPVTVQSGGQFSPGASLGTLTISNNLVLSAGSTNRFDVNTDTLEHDRVAGLNTLACGGTLMLELAGSGAALTNGAALKLFDAVSCSGTFAAIVPATPGPGLVWDGSGLTNGTLRIAATVSLAPINLGARVNGSRLELSWPPDHIGWWLECQTNALDVGLSTNWHPMPGSLGTNWLSLPVDPGADTVFYRLVYASIKDLRQAAANRRRRIIYNNDGAEPARSMTSPTVQNLLEIRTLGVEGTQVDSIFYTPRCSGFGLFTYFTTIGSIFTATGASYGNNMMGPLLAAGIDPLRVMVDFSRQHGIEVFCSFRMNDTHDGAANDDAPVIFSANALKVNHPEYLLGTANNDPPIGAWTAVDYARPEIRELAFRFAEEVCTNYDVDGIELDFFRHPVFFKSTAAGSLATVAERTAMTELMQRIRAMADDVGRARSKPILIAMRVPDSVEYCRAIGLELDTWLANDLLDLLVVSSYFQLHDWDYSVALARQYGVKIYPSLDESRISDATAQALRMTDRAYRGRAANVWGFGADGVYMFNFFDRLSPLWQQLGETQVLSGLDKDYFGSVRGAVNSAGGNLSYASYQTIEKLNPSNTKTVAPGGTATARINVGEDLSQAGAVNLKFRLQFSTAVNPQLLSVTCNSQPLAFAGTNQLWLEYSVAPSVVQQVTNHVRVTLSPSASQVTWRDLMLEVRH